MGLIQNLVKGIGTNKKEFKEKLKQVQEEDKITNLINERKKSSNRRELERYMKEKEEKEIKKQLDIIRKKKKEEMWHGNSMLKQKSILKNDRPILKEGKNILKQKNIFLDNKSNIPFVKGGGMFFN